ncbi:hypothetical protein [Halarcobacter ebronensis]|uniref:hypothetical protein n=1 Tax=Halarcobacter ebronensis TaxID=1462615 RepID=UPI0034DD87B6
MQLARRLLKFDNQDVMGTAFAIGYQSLSQFSNDYSKYFGINPSLEIKKSKIKGIVLLKHNFEGLYYLQLLVLSFVGNILQWYFLYLLL